MVAAAGSCSADADFTSLAGIVLGAGPEPARLARMEMALGSSWQPGPGHGWQWEGPGSHFRGLAYDVGGLRLVRGTALKSNSVGCSIVILRADIKLTGSFGRTLYTWQCV